MFMNREKEEPERFGDGALDEMRHYMNGAALILFESESNCIDQSNEKGSLLIFNSSAASRLAC
jgi:hypothetical protein